MFLKKVRRIKQPSFVAGFPCGALHNLAHLDLVHQLSLWAIVPFCSASASTIVRPAGRMVFGVDFGATQFECHNEPLDITNNLFKWVASVV